jgi:hypothetical protein
MNEEFLHYIWKMRRFEQRHLHTTSGRPLEIRNFGFYNTQAGPDFQQGSIFFEGQTWHGHIEIHLKSSDWYAHGHQTDPNYDNVILHVVYEHDREVYRADGSTIPTLELVHYIEPNFYWHYEQFIGNQKKIPCEGQISQVPAVHITHLLEQRLVDRLLRKADLFQSFLKSTNNDWHASILRFFAHGFGLKVNALAFVRLFEVVPHAILARHAHELHTLESLLFGASGLLPEQSQDVYVMQLMKTWEFYQYKYQLHAMRPQEWKFHRMRPAAFPPRRIAQLAMLLHKNPNLVSFAMQEGFKNPMLFSVAPSDYWQHHYHFHKPAPQPIGAPGGEFIKSLQINVQLPFLYFHAQHFGQWEVADAVMDVLKKMPPERNSVVQLYEKLGFEIRSSFDSQAILELNKHFCRLKKCLNCDVGNHLLKPT